MVFIKKGRNHNFLSIIGLIGFIISVVYFSGKSSAAGFILSLFFIFLFLESFILGVKSSSEEKKPSVLPYRVAPLSSGYMATSIIGILASFLFIYPTFSEAWGTAFGIVFIFMFIASLISMTNAPLGGQLETEVHRDSLDVGKMLNRRK